MKTIEVIVHCYAEKRPDFAKLLTAQLSSIATWPPSACNLLVTVCGYDDLAYKVVDEFDDILDCDFGSRIRVRWERMESREAVFRRAIGRNIAGKKSRADIVWFCDCDYLFGLGCLQTLSQCSFKGIAFPKEAQIHESHAVGDQELARITPGELFIPNLRLFKPWRCKYAIGGLQIVDGDTARKGYLDNTKWTRPVPNATDFLDTREDKVYRGTFLKSTGIILPNLLRFRHSASAFETPESRLKQTS